MMNIFISIPRFRLFLLLPLLLLFLGGGALPGCKRDVGITKLYQCPMHPQVIKDRPGKCPICGMDLVPIENGETHQDHKDHQAHIQPRDLGVNGDQKEEAKEVVQPVVSPLSPLGIVAGRAPVTHSPKDLARLGVQLAPVSYGEFFVPLRLSGRVSFDPKRLFVVPTRVSGWVTAIYRSQPGEFVKRGELLYRLYSPEAAAAIEEYRRLMDLSGHDGSLGDEESSYSGTQSLLPRVFNLFISPDLLARLREIKEIPKEIPFISPRSGYLVELKTRVGEWVSFDTPLFLLADLSEVILEAYLPLGWELPKISTRKLTGVIHLLSGGAEAVTFAVVSMHYDSETRTRKLNLWVKNREQKMIPGDYLSVELRLPYGRLFVVPDSALIFTGDGYIVFVSDQRGGLNPRAVEVLVRTQGKAGIRSGVKEGELVVVDGTFLLDADSRLKALVLTKSGGKDAHAHH